MAHLNSKHTGQISLTLDSAIPGFESLEKLYQPLIIQGNTVMTFVLSALQQTTSQRDTDGWRFAGVDSLTFEAGDGTVKSYEGAYNEAFASNRPVLPLTSFDHTYFSTGSAATDLSARITIVYSQTAGTGASQLSALSAAHVVQFKRSADNVVDRNLDVLNSQMFTYENNIIPYFNLETDENIIYPVSYFEVTTSFEPGRGIYLNTNQEIYPEGWAGIEYLSETRFAVSSALSAISNSLSGAGFTIQSNSGSTTDDPQLYTFVFSITGDEPVVINQAGDMLIGVEAISSRPGEDIISVFTPQYSTTEFELSSYYNLFSNITAAADERGLIGRGKAFSNVSMSVISGSTDNRFNQNFLTFNNPPLAPPVAAKFTFSSRSSASIGYANRNFVWQPFYPQPNGSFLTGGIDSTFLYPTSGYPLSASGRISTDPDANNITVI